MFSHDPRTAGFGPFQQFGGFTNFPQHGSFGFQNHYAAPTAYASNPYASNPYFSAPYVGAPAFGYAMHAPYAPSFAAPATTSQTPVSGAFVPSSEYWHLLNRIEEMRAQIYATNELLRNEFVRRSHFENAFNAGHMNNTQTPVAYPYGVIPFQRPNAGYMPPDANPVRLRESESHIYCDIFLPQLTIGDVEVEAIGNRIVCRTRIPVAPASRWMPGMTQLPRGFEFFELPDGRVECSWLCHAPFQAKDVEVTFRDGFLCICVAKTEVATNRHQIKVAKDGMGRRAANEAHS